MGQPDTAHLWIMTHFPCDSLTDLLSGIPNLLFFSHVSVLIIYTSVSDCWLGSDSEAHRTVLCPIITSAPRTLFLLAGWTKAWVIANTAWSLPWAFTTQKARGKSQQICRLVKPPPHLPIPRAAHWQTSSRAAEGPKVRAGSLLDTHWEWLTQMCSDLNADVSGILRLWMGQETCQCLLAFSSCLMDLKPVSASKSALHVLLTSHSLPS